MTTIEKIRAAWLAARRERSATISNLLGTIIADCENQAHGRSGKAARELTDGEVIAVVQAMAKNIAQTMSLIEGNATRAEEHTKLTVEAAALVGYLPVRLTEEELRLIAIRQDALGFNLGKIMAYLKTEYPGRYDAQQASAIIKEVLAKD